MQQWPEISMDAFSKHIEIALGQINGIAYEWDERMQHWFIEFGISPFDQLWIPVEKQDQSMKWCQMVLNFDEQGTKNTSIDIRFHRIIGSEKTYSHVLQHLCIYFDELIQRNILY